TRCARSRALRLACPRAFAPRTPLHAHSRGPRAPLRSRGSLAALVRALFVWTDGGSLRGQELLFQDGAVVVNHFTGDAAVVVLVLNAHASAPVIYFLGEQG